MSNTKNLVKTVQNRMKKLGVSLSDLASHYQCESDLSKAKQLFAVDFQRYMTNEANRTRISPKSGKPVTISLKVQSERFADHISEKVAESTGIELNPIVRGASGRRVSTLDAISTAAAEFGDLEW